MKQISELTANDFTQHITSISDFNIMSNLNVNFSKSHSGDHLYWSTDTPSHIYVACNVDIFGGGNSSIPSFPNSSDFYELTNHNKTLSYSDVGVTIGSFKSSRITKNVWIYFVPADQPIAPAFNLIIDDNELESTTTWNYDKDKSLLTVTPKDGYQINSASLNSLDEYGESTKSYPLTKQSNGTFTLTLTDEIKSNVNGFSLTGDAGKIVLTYTGTITNRDNNSTYKLDKDTITITPKSGTLKKVSGSIQQYAGGDATKINAAISNNVATLVVPQDYLNNSSAAIFIYVTYVQTLQTLGVTDETHENATLSVVDNTMTITPTAGYKVKSAEFYTTDQYDFNNPPTTKNLTNFTVDDNSGVATLTINNVDSIPDNSILHVDYTTEKMVKPPTKYTGLAVKALDNTTINFNGVNSWTVTCETGYHISNLHVDASWVGVGEKIKDIVTPTISNDKKSATFMVTDENYLTRANIYLRGDIAKDFVPPKPSTGNENVRLYEVDDDTLEAISKKDFTYFEDGKNVVYDFQQFINQLYKLPFSIPNSYLTTTSQVITGFFTLDVPAYKINKQTYSLDLGKITVPATNGFDYNLKSVSLLLPWVETIKINASNIIGKTIHVVYNVNLLDGSTTVVIYSDDTVINSIKINISTNIEMFNIYANKQNGNLNSTLQNDLRQAYIKVDYYKPIDNLISYPTNEHGTLKDYTGYTQTKNVILNKSINSTIDNMIIGNLNSGVIIKWH